MIYFHSEADFTLPAKMIHKQWIRQIIDTEKKKAGDINYIFCDNAYLLNINQQYLQHDTFTDVITFDYTENDRISGDIFISVDMIRDNSILYGVSFDEELTRVMSHGIYHLCGYKDKTEKDSMQMRIKESEAIEMAKVSHII